MMERIDLDQPRWDQTQYLGRAKHFLWVTDPRVCLTPKAKLFEARSLLEAYRKGEEPAGTTPAQIHYAHKLCLSAFHPDTGNIQNFIGRMSFQVPGGMILIGCMNQFYKSLPAVIFWQWANQSFNALVNYTNCNASSNVTQKNIIIAYVSATASALITALTLKSYLSKSSNPILQRLFPFAAVAAANIVNIPLMRQSELINGVTLYDENNNKVTESRYAAIKGISQVIISRIIMCAPSMTILPLMMARMEKRAWMQRIRVLHTPMQIFFAGAFLLVMTPAACAIFPQKCSISLEKLKILDKENYADVIARYGDAAPKTLYFNKGL